MVGAGKNAVHPRRHPRGLPLTRPWCIATAVLLLACALSLRAGAAQYATWVRWEADKLAAAWLIKRFADPDARFVFLPPGTPPPAGTIPFDIPGAPLARTARTTTYAAVRRRYRPDDPVLARIGLFINDLELNVWEDKAFPESRAIAAMVARATQGDPPPDVILATAFRFFDDLYARLGRRMVPAR